ncbi:hypothetical protein PPSIR1_05713 [Plesiocystis pacifica SIR-1]|uniref:VWFA domain-containing protein n=2 Tax=Plesiocystis pacifica TaxID=191768 RepID=A6FXB5_9BACT|nr:hypothetical protein PPSIR1_05713 [Plesiocystis pacifica SIR-1]
MMMKRLSTLLTALALTPSALLVACGDSGGEEGGGDEIGATESESESSTGDAGTDTETGSEDATTTETDSSTDADTETSTDTETETDTETSMDTETSTDTGTDTTEESTDTTEGETETTDEGMMESSEDEMPCVELSATLEPVPPNVMMVLDKSGSMFTNTWDHDNNGGTPQITRWNSLYDVVDNITTTFDDSINFGANLFPSTLAQNIYGPQACTTSNFPEVTVGENNSAQILATIPGPGVTASYGGTPATLGVTTAYNHLTSLDPELPRAMILVTDGAANCDQNAANNFQLFDVYDDGLPVIVGTAAANGVPTYVVGIDIINQTINDGIGGDPNGINPTVVLNEVAAAGGTGSFFNTEDQAELEAALTDVVASVQTCTIPLSEEPFFPEFTEVIVGGQSWDMINDCGDGDGWFYSDPYTTIELCGAACDALKQAGEADIDYYCNPG